MYWTDGSGVLNAKAMAPVGFMRVHHAPDGFLAKYVIGEWITLYNTERPHTALEKRTPDVNRPQFAGGSKVSMDGAYGKK